MRGVLTNKSAALPWPMDCIVLVNQLRIDTSTETMTSDLANQFVAKVQAEARGFLTLLYLPFIVIYGDD